MAVRSDVAAALTKSATAFRDVVWPVICDDLGGGELVPVESVTAASFAKDLDTLAGVDAWQVADPHGMRSIASRVQSGWGPLNTFTIRWSVRSGARTEIDKRIDAIRDGFLYPLITVQAYLTCPLNPGCRNGCRCASWIDHPLLSVGSIDTVALFKFASDWRDAHAAEADLWKGRDGAWVKDVTGGNRLLAIRWSSLSRVTTWQPPALVPALVDDLNELVW